MDNNSFLSIDYNKKFSDKVVSLMNKHNISNLLICGVLDLKPTAVSELLAGRSRWMLQHVVKIAAYFTTPIEELIFDDPNFIKKFKENINIEMKQNIKDFLVKEKKTTTYGKLYTDGFFDDLENKNKKS